MSLTPLVLLDTKIYMSSADLTGYSNKVDLPVTVEALEKTTFGDGGWKSRVGGMFDMSGSIEGFWQAGDVTMPDDLFWANLGTAVPATFVPTGGAPGDLAYVTKILQASYDMSGEIGQLVAFTVDMQGNAPVARGQVAHAYTSSAIRTASGTGTALQISAVVTNQRMYANLHVLSASGTSPSLTVKVQSAASSSFASATDRITFTAATTVGGQVGSVLGNITDTWWRVVYTLAGTSPSFGFAVALGAAAK